MVHVAGEMERRGFDHAAADRRRHHQPRPHGGEDRAGLRARPGGLRDRRQPRGGRCLGAARRRSARDQLEAETARPNTQIREQLARGRRPTGAHARSQAPAPTRSRSTGRAYTPPTPTFLGVKQPSAPTTSPSWPRYIDWTPFFQTWELAGASRRSWTTTWSARRPRTSSPTRRRCSTEIVDEKLV